MNQLLGVITFHISRILLVNTLVTLSQLLSTGHESTYLDMDRTLTFNMRMGFVHLHKPGRYKHSPRLVIVDVPQ